MSLWPSQVWTVRMSTPFCSQLVAAVARNLCKYQRRKAGGETGIRPEMI